MNHSIEVIIKSPFGWLLGIDRLIPPSYIPDIFYSRKISRFSFNSEKELENEFKRIFTFDKWIHLSSHYHVSVTDLTDKAAPRYVGKCLVNAMTQQKFITQIDVDNKLISDSQQSNLEILQKAAQKRKKDLLRMRNGILFGVGLFAFTTAVLTMMGMPLMLPLILKGTLFVGMAAGIISHGRNIYLDSTLHYYEKDAKTKTFDNSSEEQAFHDGTQAKDWKGYFLSYGRLSAYAHPIAFAAGMMHRMNNNVPSKREVFATEYINFAKIDKRIKHNGEWRMSHPMSTTIEIPTKQFDEIVAKLMQHPNIRKHNGNLLNGKAKAKICSF